MKHENKVRKIMIMEDERILGEIIFNKLKSEGYDVCWELNGAKGIEKMREILPDLVLLDLVMPEKDGYEVLEDIQKDDALKKIPVVIISNSGEPVELTRIIELGAKDYIIKAEFTPEEVLKKVRKYLGEEDISDAAKKALKSKTSLITLLIVEDDSFLYSLIVERLKKEGYNILTATDGIQALKVLETKTPDLIILDIIMPGMNGFEVLKKIKADPKYKDTLIIILSNLGQEHEIEEAKKLGADEFLVKANFTPKEIIEKINALLKKKGKL